MVDQRDQKEISRRTRKDNDHVGFESSYMKTSNSEPSQIFSFPFHVGPQSWDCAWLGVVLRCIRPIGSDPAFASPPITSIPPSIVIRSSPWFCCFFLQSTSQFLVDIQRDLCCFESPDQGFVAFQSPQQLIETSLHRIHLHTSFPLKSEQTHRQSQRPSFTWKNWIHRLHQEERTVTHS